MPEIVDVPLSDLLLSNENPRLKATPATQQEAALELAKEQREGEAIVKLAEDIVEHGLDPTTLPAVVATGDNRKRYRVLEGNRRILALRALETPALIMPVLKPSLNQRMNQLSAKYEQDPVERVKCVLFDSEDEVLHWIELRHTGENQGVGLVGWGTEQQQRFQERHAGKRHPARQVVDFVEKGGQLSAVAEASNRRISTNLERLLETTYVREKLGLDLVDGQIVALYPAEEILPGLTRVVEDLKTGAVSVPGLYHADDRKRYVDKLPASIRPKKSKALKEAIHLDDLASGTKTPRPVTKKRRTKKAPTRTTVIPKTAQLDIKHPRINSVYNELLSLNAEQYPNACSVMLRVFIELSTDHYISARNLIADDQLRNTALGKKLKTAAADLYKRNLVPIKLKQAIETAASSKTVLGPSLVTLHQYVHNEYVFPKTSDLYSTWDELEPFVAQLWPVT